MKQRATFQLEPAQLEQLKKLAKELGVSQSEIIRLALEAYLDAKGAGK